MDSYFIRWESALSVGDDYIDSQHKTLIDKISRVSESPSADDEKLLNDVLDYAATHFVDEEAYMTKIGYPDLQVHRFEHQKLTNMLLAHKQDYDRGIKDLYSFKQFMFRWVRDHIMESDKQIGAFLAGRR